MSNANIAKNSVGQSTGTGFIRIKRIRMVGFRSFDDYTLDTVSYTHLLIGIGRALLRDAEWVSKARDAAQRLSLIHI